MIKWDLFKECKVDLTFKNLIDVLCLINRLNAKKGHVIISVDSEKS